MRDARPHQRTSHGPGQTAAHAWLSAALVLVVGTATLLAETVGLSQLRVLARIGVLGFLVLNLTLTRRLERMFIAFALLASALVMILVPAPSAVLVNGLDQAGLFMTFVVALNVLRDAAQSSVAVRRSGHYLIAQSPPRRYLALTLGGHLFTIALNMGSLNLLGAMIHRANSLAAAGGDPQVVAIRERRMLTALLRGFGTTLLWSPMGVGVAYTLSIVPTLTWFDVAPAALALAIAWMAIGWILDRIEWPPTARLATLPRPDPVSARALAPMLAITALLLLAVIAAKLVIHSSLLVAVMSTIPFAAVLWIALQYRRLGAMLAAAATLRRMRRHLLGHLPQVRPEIVVLAIAAFLGVVLGALVGRLGLSPWLASLGLPPAVIAIAAFALIVGFAQVGVTPLVAATLVGSTVMQMTPPPVPALALALAIQAGWALSSCSSPFTGGVLLLARLIGKRSFIFQRWNLFFTAACSALTVIIFIVWLGR